MFQDHQQRAPVLNRKRMHGNGDKTATIYKRVRAPTIQAGNLRLKNLTP